jgi:predicted nucleic acid-binding protein
VTRWILADTSALVGLFLRNDEWHEPARRVFEELRSSNRPMIATSDIFDETVTAIRRWAGFKRSVEAGEALMTSRLVTLIPIDDRARDGAWRRFRKLNLPHLSLTDCTSFEIMDRFRLKEAFTFDGDFGRAGYDVIPASR